MLEEGPRSAFAKTLLRLLLCAIILVGTVAYSAVGRHHAHRWRHVASKKHHHKRVRHSKHIVRHSKVSLAVVKPSVSMRDHNAFLDNPVWSVDALTAQVKSNPEVTRRYELQFKIGQEEILRFFEGLHIESLKKTQRYLVFNVDDKLRIRSRRLLLKKGTLVFADRDHKPVLKRSCGNPMIADFAAEGKKPTKTLTESDKPAEERLQTGGDSGPIGQVGGDGSTLTSLTPASPLEELVADSGPGTVSGPPIPIALVTGGSLPSATLAPGGLGLGALLAGGEIAGSFSGSRGRPPAVPEPSTFAALGVGILAATRSRRRRPNQSEVVLPQT